ncbi:putative glycosyl transferase [Rhizocola hellebori]|uniref:Putative glycosyl transferase n=1 Tax=Rhizocola hellebori TaxID=1392758 RepID=A0A8J3QAG1_9ACTN|nr:glycosyltransferase family 4 protein [Rhizocola hellebori]GIH06272.1 putative glycosyl transferase [Rhizocola hellebori]
MDISAADRRHVLLLNWRDTRNPEGGGSEVYVEQLAAELVARGHRATVLCAAHPHGPAEEHTADGVTVLRRGSRHTVYPRAALTYLAGLVGLGRLSRRGLGRPDVIVDVGNGIPFLSKLYSRKPVIVLVHHVHREQWPVVMGRITSKIGWWIESRLAIRVYRGCQYVTVSEATRRELRNLGVEEGRVTVVHNGTPVRPPVNASRSSEPSLIVLGRLVPHKRVEIALRTLAELAPELPGLRLTIAGTGWWEPHLRQLADELGVTDRTHFAGFVTEEAKHEFLSRAWVALTPSLKEGWGLTIVEAGSACTPTVAFAAAGGVTEALVDGETGLLAQDEEHFVKLVRELLRESGRREAMGQAAREHAASFNWTVSGDRFAALISGRAPQAVEPEQVAGRR